jgi:putative aldouronate transport system permease protein
MLNEVVDAERHPPPLTPSPGIPTATVSPLSVRLSLFTRSVVRQRYLLAMALAGVAWMFIFNYLPMYGLLIAFRNYSITRPFSEAPYVGLTHFRAFFADPQFPLVMRNTLGISGLKLIVGFPIPIVFAIMLSEVPHSAFKRVVQTITYLPHFLSWVILGGIMMHWLSDIGLINRLFVALGLLDEPVYFLAQPRMFWTIAVASDVWKETGFNAIIYLAAIAGIDPQLYEAANLDGATRLQKIRHVTLPGIAGTIVILLVLNVGYLLNTNFDQILVLTNQLNIDTSNVLDLHVYRVGIQAGRYSFSTAIGFFRSVIALILLMLASFTTRRLTGHSMF